jgi:hypothetical protein
MVRNLRIRFETFESGFTNLDLHEYLEGPGDLYGTGLHPITKEGLPRTFGHEFAGILFADNGGDYQARFWKLAQK